MDLRHEPTHDPITLGQTKTDHAVLKSVSLAAAWLPLPFGDFWVSLAMLTNTQVVIVIIAMGLVWYCAATLLELVGSCILTSSTWSWMLRSFAADANLDASNHSWAGCYFSFTSIHGATSRVGGNVPLYEVGVTEVGLALRVPLYTPPFIRIWRWPFSVWLFPPCLIPWDKVTNLTQNDCFVQSLDHEWPTMRISTSDEMLNRIRIQQEIMVDPQNGTVA